MKKYKKLILKLAVSVGLITVILVKVDRSALVENFKLLNWRYVPLIIGLLVANYVISSVRWKALLIVPEVKKVSVPYLTKLYFIGSFFNNFMPTSVGGDVYKIFRLGKFIDNKTAAFSATFMERFTGVIALVMISSVSMVRLWGIKGIVLFIGFWLAVIAGFVSLKILGKKVKVLKKVHDSLFAYSDHKKTVATALATSLLVQLASIFTQYFIFVALGHRLDLTFALFVFPLITLASFFVPSLNGIGVQDALYINLIASPTLGLTAAVGLSASVLYHLFRLFVSLVGGILYALDKD